MGYQAPRSSVANTAGLRSVLGIRSVSYVQGKKMLATIDQPWLRAEPDSWSLVTNSQTRSNFQRSGEL